MTFGLPPNFSFRSAQKDDGPALSSFECSRGGAHEDEVEHFIRHDALGRALASRTDYRLLVVLEEERLIGVAGCMPEFLLLADDRRDWMEATRLHVLALARTDQGRRVADGRRLSDLVMETLIAEAMGPAVTRVLTAVVAKENLRSIALCERHGLTAQVEFDVRHVRLSGSFAKRR